MNRIEFLKTAIRNGKLNTKKWIISAFTLVDNVNMDMASKTPYDIIYNGITYSYVDSTGNIVPITDSPKGEPLFRFLENIDIDSSWAVNIDKPIKTIVGNLLFNAICIVPSFGKNISFITGKVSVSNIENMISPVLLSDPEDNNFISSNIYVRDYVRFVDSLGYISGLANITVVSATIKNIQIAPGLDEYKSKLLKEYGGNIKDTSTFIDFEKKLTDYDDAYMKDDPSTRSFMTGKVKNIARKKMYLTFGKERTFEKEENSIPVINSLHQGWPKEKKQFTELMNITRAGSFSRGAETVKGGVSAKILLRSISNFKIAPGDCKTKLGIHMKYNSNNINNLAQRYILKGDKPVLVASKEEAKEYVGKDILVRSPMYCKLEGDNICEICAGKRLSANPTGLSVPVTEVSAIFLLSFMKAMHGKVLSESKMDLNEVFS